VGTVFVFLLVVLLTVAKTAAQPTDRRDFREIEHEFKEWIDETDKLISVNGPDVALYRRRAGLYQELYRLTQYYKKSHNESYAGKGLADISRVIDLNPVEESFAERARFHEMIWKTHVPSSAIRLGRSDERIRTYLIALSDLHWGRAATLAHASEMLELRALDQTYSIWSDFDTAIDYAKEAYEHAKKATAHGGNAGYWAEYSRSNVASVHRRKGEAAFALDQFEIALTAYQAGEKYIHERYSWSCNYYAEWGGIYLKLNRHDPAIEKFTKALTAAESECPYVFELRADAYAAKGDLARALADYTAGPEKYPAKVLRDRVVLKRAKVYLKLGQGEKALADLNSYIEKIPQGYCPQAYLLRAQAHRQLGNVKLALADEQTAGQLRRSSTLSSPGTCVEL
jgi:tetratricopeptide (TPR) repeat protein